MINPASESDVGILRQTVQLLLAENERLHRRLLELTRRLASAEGHTATQLELEIMRLQEQLQARTHQLFGASSEKRSRPEDKPSSTPKPAPRGHGPRPQPQLPIVEVEHPLDAADQMCPSCGGDLQPWDGQFETAEEIDVVERSFRIVRHKRQKYRCGCGSCIETALGPDKLIAGGRYSVDFAVAVAIDKYADHSPLARQVRAMSRHGLSVDTQTLWDQLWALSRHLLPSYEALGPYVRRAEVIGADETSWRLMEKAETTRWWVWALTAPDAVFYRILAERSARAAAQVLADYGGIVIADGYGAYEALRKQQQASGAGPPFTLAACWAHSRRKFVEAEPNYPEAKAMIDLIAELYQADAEAKAGSGADAITRRRAECAPILERMRHWLETTPALPKSSLGTAIRYTLNLWPGLTRFVAHPGIALDNNATERALRGVAIGRKNHYGSRSLRGTEVAALFYSLIESAKLAGIEPASYLREAARRAIRNPGTVTLPHQMLGTTDPA